MTLPVVRDWRLGHARTSLAYAPEALERYAFAQLDLLRRVVKDIEGLRILEIGPGDHIAAGLCFLAAGAATYTSVDRFPGPHSSASAKAWYAGVRAAWASRYPDLPWPPDLDPGTFPEAHLERAKNAAVPIELYRPPEAFDVIFSFDVGEHVSDIRGFAQTTARLLTAQGTAVHRVNFGPHGRWETYPDPFVFLGFPEWCWQLMGSQRGLPNRFRFHEFLQVFDAAGLEVEVLDRQVLHRPVDQMRLARRFRSMPTESIQTASAVFVCTRR